MTGYRKGLRAFGVSTLIVCLAACGGGSGSGSGGSSSGGTDTPLVQAKALVQDVRNTVQTEEGFKTPLKTFVNQVDATATLTDPASNSLFASLGQAATAASAFYSSQSGQPGTTTLTTTNSSGAQQTATVTVASSSGTTTVSIKGNVRNESINVALNFTQDPQHASTKTLNASVAPNSSITTNGSGPGVKLVMKTGTLTINKSDAQPVAHNSSNISGGSVTLDAVLSQQNLPSGNSPVNFEGTLTADAVQCTAQTCQNQITAGRSAVFTPSSFDLAGKFSQASNTANAELAASLTNAAKFDPDLPVSGSNVPAGHAELKFDANIPNVPPTAVDLVADLTSFYRSTTGQDSAPIGTATVTFTQNNGKLLVVTVTTSAPSSGSGQPNINAEITDSKGAVLTLKNPFSGAKSGDLGQATVNGTMVGTISKVTSGAIIITYTDGAFETLFN